MYMKILSASGILYLAQKAWWTTISISMKIPHVEAPTQRILVTIMIRYVKAKNLIRKEGDQVSNGSVYADNADSLLSASFVYCR